METQTTSPIIQCQESKKSSKVEDARKKTTTSQKDSDIPKESHLISLSIRCKRYAFEGPGQGPE
jgi:hypothetical protein